MWRGVDVDDPASVALFARAGTAMVTAAQQQAVVLSDGYVAAYTSVTLGRRVSPVGVTAGPLLGRTTAGRPIGEVLTRAAITARVTRAAGGKTADMRQAGTNLLNRRLGTEIQETARGGLYEAMDASPHVSRFAVITGPTRCPTCASIAAQGPRAVGSQVKFHDHCRCILQPVVA